MVCHMGCLVSVCEWSCFGVEGEVMIEFWSRLSDAPLDCDGPKSGEGCSKELDMVASGSSLEGQDSLALWTRASGPRHSSGGSETRSTRAKVADDPP